MLFVLTTLPRGPFEGYPSTYLSIEHWVVARVLLDAAAGRYTLLSNTYPQLVAVGDNRKLRAVMPCDPGRPHPLPAAVNEIAVYSHWEMPFPWLHRTSHYDTGWDVAVWEHNLGNAFMFYIPHGSHSAAPHLLEYPGEAHLPDITAIGVSPHTSPRLPGVAIGYSTGEVSVWGVHVKSSQGVLVERRLVRVLECPVVRAVVGSDGTVVVVDALLNVHVVEPGKEPVQLYRSGLTPHAGHVREDDLALVFLAYDEGSHMVVMTHLDVVRMFSTQDEARRGMCPLWDRCVDVSLHTCHGGLFCTVALATHIPTVFDLTSSQLVSKVPLPVQRLVPVVIRQNTRWDGEVACASYCGTLGTLVVGAPHGYVLHMHHSKVRTVGVFEAGGQPLDLKLERRRQRKRPTFPPIVRVAVCGDSVMAIDTRGVVMNAHTNHWVEYEPSVRPSVRILSSPGFACDWGVLHAAVFRNEHLFRGATLAKASIAKPTSVRRQPKVARRWDDNHEAAAQQHEMA